MKIALLTDGIYPYVIGGMQKHSYYVAKYFAKNGVHVDLYHFNSNKDYHIAQLELFEEEEKKYIHSFVLEFPNSSKFPGHYIRESYEYSRRIFEIFKENSKVDFIYVKGFAGWKLIEERKKGFKCAPVAINFHGMEMFQPPYSWKGYLEQLLLRRPVLFNLKNADYVFSYGSKITDIIIKEGIGRKHIIELPAGIEKSWLNEDIKPVNKIRKFIFIGRYERRKGIEELNQILKRLIYTKPTLFPQTLSKDCDLVDPEQISEIRLLSGYNVDFEFHFVGFIPENKKIKHPKIKYRGVITDTVTLQSILQECDCLICPSYSEGMPNVILEAMAQGLAVIATDGGAVNLLVNENTGWLIQAGNFREIEKTILKAVKMSDEELLQKKKNGQRLIREKYLWDTIIQKLIRQIHDRIL